MLGMGAEWAAPLSALAGAVIGGGLSLFGGALTSRRQSGDKRAELHQQMVASSRDLVLAEIRTLLTAFDEFIQVHREAEDISAQRAAAIEQDEQDEALNRALRGGKREQHSLMEYADPAFRSRPEFDLLFKEWRERVRDALPRLEDAVSSVEIAVPARFSQHAETFLRAAESLVKSFDRSTIYHVETADVPRFTTVRAALVKEVRTWLFGDDESSRARPGHD
jgi:hypothetical protein